MKKSFLVKKVFGEIFFLFGEKNLVIFLGFFFCKFFWVTKIQSGVGGSG